MTDYALREVILNGDSPLPTRTVGGVKTAVPPTIVDQKLARKNELKARGTMLMALPNEHQLKFNSYKSAKSLMEAIEKRFGDLETLCMDDLYNNLKIYEVEVIGSSSTSQNIQNVAFVSSNITGSTNEAVKTAHGVSVANSKANASTLPNVDSLSDAEMDLKWQMAMLTIRARRFLKKTGKNLGVNGTDTIGFDKTKVECYNFHKTSKQQDNKNREITRRTIPVQETTSNALVSQCDGFGYDWSDQAEEGPTNFTLMAYTSSGSSSSLNSDTEVSTCSKACLKSYETLKEHYDNLTKDFNKSQLNLGAYKAGLESVEARLDVYKKNEAIFEEDIKILKLDIMLRDNALTELRKKFKKVEKERDDLKLTLEKFESSSKNLSKLLEIEELHAPKPNLVLADEDEYVFSESVTSVPVVATSEVKTSQNLSLFNHLIKDCDFYEKKMVEKPVWNNARRVNHQNSQRMSHPHPKRNFVPKSVLMKSSLKTLNTARQASNVFHRAHSHVTRLFNKFTTNKNSNFNEKVNIVKRNVTTVGPKAVVSNNKGIEANVVKASACWIWRPKQKVLDHVSKHNGASINFKRFDYIDAQGISKSVMAWVPKRN
ncbi:hypothetical protein Tco_0509744 [Tanacetum coccineum]